MSEPSNDKLYYAALGGVAVLIAAALISPLLTFVLLARSEAELESVFLAGMEAGNQSCSVLVPERQRRKPQHASGGLL